MFTQSQPLFTVHELFTCFYRLPDTFNKVLGDSLRCFHARKFRCLADNYPGFNQGLCKIWRVLRAASKL